MEHLLTIHPALAHSVLNEDYAEIQNVAKFLLRNGVDSASAASASHSTNESEPAPTQRAPAHFSTTEPTPAVFPSTQPEPAQFPITQQTSPHLNHVQTPHAQTTLQPTTMASSATATATTCSTIPPMHCKETASEANRTAFENIPAIMTSAGTQRGGSGSEGHVVIDEEFERQREVRVSVSGDKSDA